MSFSKPRLKTENRNFNGFFLYYLRSISTYLRKMKNEETSLKIVKPISLPIDRRRHSYWRQMMLTAYEHARHWVPRGFSFCRFGNDITYFIVRNCLFRFSTTSHARATRPKISLMAVARTTTRTISTRFRGAVGY